MPAPDALNDGVGTEVLHDATQICEEGARCDLYVLVILTVLVIRSELHVTIERANGLCHSDTHTGCHKLQCFLSPINRNLQQLLAQFAGTLSQFLKGYLRLLDLNL